MIQKNRKKGTSAIEEAEDFNEPMI